MRIDWTRNAKMQLQSIHDFIAQHSPRYAKSLVDVLTRKSIQLFHFPELGAEVPEYGDPSIRELLVQSYRIIYRKSDQSVEILSVVHGSQPLPRSIPN